ncbi:MAG TPA: hypothetical protein DDX92_14030 [Flavobacteriales bacterium]|nr:hypothetical protein [Flavobacteriales bacterium]
MSEAPNNDKSFLGQLNLICDYTDGRIVSDQKALLKDGLEARLLVYEDYTNGKAPQFVTYMFDYDAMTIVQLYNYR